MLVLLSAMAAACRAAAFTAPSGSAITLVASARAVPLDGGAEITAFLFEGALGGGGGGGVIAGAGAPVHDGTEVFFSTSLGRLDAALVRTRGGRAAVRLASDGRSGTATVTAMSGPASSSVEIDIGAVAVARVTVTAQPQTLPAAGGTSSIAARVEDAQGNGVPGVLVSFSTTRGTLAPTAATTGMDGYARTVLATSADATVTAASGGFEGRSVVAVRPATRIGITPPASAMLGVPATFTITPAGEARITDVDVDFGDGESAWLGAIAAATSLAHVFRRTGELPITAIAVDGDGQRTMVATRVVVVPLAATGTSTPANGVAPVVGEPVSLVVTPAPGATVDAYRWELGGGIVRTTGSGQLTHAFRSRGTNVVSVRVYPYKSTEFTTVLIAVDVQ
jgi:hypothetical protein